MKGDEEIKPPIRWNSNELLSSHFDIRYGQTNKSGKKGAGNSECQRSSCLGHCFALYSGHRRGKNPPLIGERAFSPTCYHGRWRLGELHALYVGPQADHLLLLLLLLLLERHLVSLLLGPSLLQRKHNTNHSYLCSEAPNSALFGSSAIKRHHLGFWSLAKPRLCNLTRIITILDKPVDPKSRRAPFLDAVMAASASEAPPTRHSTSNILWTLFPTGCYLFDFPKKSCDNELPPPRAKYILEREAHVKGITMMSL